MTTPQPQDLIVTDDILAAAIAAVKAELLGGAGPAFDTLNELAAALGGDPDFATSIATQIDGKADQTHTHAVSDVTGLQAELDGKAPASHQHPWSEVTNKPATYPAATHSHSISDVSGLQDELDGAVANEGGVTGIRRVTQAEYDSLTPDPTTMYVIRG